jgi:hypothetical protein
MTFKKAVGVGLPVATILHLLVFADRLSSPFLFPGFFAHFLITGLHGDDRIVGAAASMVEIMTNGVCYALLLSGGFSVAKRVKHLY